MDYGRGHEYGRSKRVTSPAGIATKAARLGRGVATDGARYPALRLSVTSERAAAAALGELGFPVSETAARERDYARVAAETFPRLLERAREVGAAAPAAKLAR